MDVEDRSSKKLQRAVATKILSKMFSDFNEPFNPGHVLHACKELRLNKKNFTNPSELVWVNKVANEAETIFHAKTAGSTAASKILEPYSYTEFTPETLSAAVSLIVKEMNAASNQNEFNQSSLQDDKTNLPAYNFF